MDNGSYLLSTSDFANVRWYDSKNKLLGTSSSVEVTPKGNSARYTVYAMTDDGKEATGTYEITIPVGIKNVSVVNDNTLKIEYYGPARANSRIAIHSAATGEKYLEEEIAEGSTESCLTTTNLPEGVIVIRYTENVEDLGQIKMKY